MKGIKDWAGMISLAVLLAFSAMAAAEDEKMYSWVDANGEAHYSDQPPPPEVKEYRSMTRSGSTTGTAASAAPAGESLADRDADFQRRRAEEAEEEARAEAVAAERKQNCTLARSQYNTISAGGRITRRNADNEVVYLDENEIAIETERARAEMEKWCDS